MINQATLGSQLALDVKGSADLQRAAKQNSPDALKGVAKQFEALFMNMLMKGMREASPQEGVFDSQQGKMFTAMLDQQLSQNMASRGVGLADVLYRQLSKQQGMSSVPADGSDGAAMPALPPQLPPELPPAAMAPAAASEPDAAPLQGRAPAHVQAFQAKLAAHAEEASRATGIPAKFMLGQAALESGWGKREILGADGSTSHNLFGIKAAGGWKGRVVEARTTEFVNGVAQQRTEKFRAYDSYADAFRDYANLLRKNPRYESVIAAGGDAQGFAHALQRAGYATDPAYASKLTRIIRQNLV